MEDIRVGSCVLSRPQYEYTRTQRRPGCAGTNMSLESGVVYFTNASLCTDQAFLVVDDETRRLRIAKLKRLCSKFENRSNSVTVLTRP